MEDDDAPVFAARSPVEGLVGGVGGILLFVGGVFLDKRAVKAGALAPPFDPYFAKMATVAGFDPADIHDVGDLDDLEPAHLTFVVFVS